MQSLRITIVYRALDLGGISTSIINLANALVKRGHNVTILTKENKPDFYPPPKGINRVLPELACLSNCKWYSINQRIKKFCCFRKSILGTCPDLVISFYTVINNLVLLALFGEKIPVIVRETTDPRYHKISFFHHFLRFLLYPTAARVVLIAEESLSWAKRFLPRWKVSVIMNPVLIPPIQKSHIERPQWFSENNIITLGRLSYEKGHDLLIEAFMPLAEKFPGWNLTIIGEGSQRFFLEERLKVLGLNQRVFLPGAIVSPFDILRQADLFVFSSRYEGFGNALAEALACGLPCISFACPSGPSHIIRHGIDGLLVPPENVLSLTQAMELLMRNEKTREEMSVKAMEIIERFSLDDNISIWESVFTDICY